MSRPQPAVARLAADWTARAASAGTAPTGLARASTARLALAWTARIALAGVASLAFATAAIAEEAQLDLVGTWHVLVHYTDSDSANPEILRWDDRLWVFEKKGSRLKWTEYPIVVFDDREGRFERSASGQRRVLHAWQPNAAQRAQIDAGLEFNSRGARTKTLRRSKKDGRWQSSAAPAVQSATTVGYHETWVIHDPTGLPKFVRDDILGSQRAETMNGRTRYDADQVSRDGARVSGTFARDESRRGTFRMVRAGAAASVGTKRTPSERIEDMMRDGIEAAAEADARAKAAAEKAENASEALEGEAEAMPGDEGSD